MSLEEDAIAVTGIACCFPGASDLRLFWENILTRRRQFRRIPDQRLPLADYYDPDPAAVDKTYGTRAAVLDGFEFDWVKWRIPKTSFESTDIVHWLALDTAQRAFEDAGYSKGKIPTRRSGVILGNTLTGEQTRSQSLRLRWPYVRRVLLASARSRGFSERQAAELAETMEAYYKSVFAPITEDSLAGGLSNTIAGRICNYFDLHGGGYSVDGACSSSLIAVVTAARSLAHGDLDLALAGGVDVSLDTFELIGFAKTGALSATDMRVYDRKASGFIPGEGCGFVVLKRLRDARADGDYVYATFSGWGLSSDGKGGITAPSGKGQSIALSRAYSRGSHVTPVLDFVEGHGTGTSVGDREELKGLAMALGDLGETSLRSCGITSVKSLIGHTKAAAGVAGFIKAVLAVNQRVLPPTAGCTDPNPVFAKEARHIYPVLRGEVRPPTSVLRAGVSAMGFGGINSHVILESADPPSDRLKPDPSARLDEQALLASSQASELFVLAAASVDGLLRQLRDLGRSAEWMSDAEMVDLAARMADEVGSEKPWRAAIVARSPATLSVAFGELERMLTESAPSPGETIGSRQQGIWLGNGVSPPRLGFLFPGQGSQQLNMARRLVERHSWARELIAQVSVWMDERRDGVEGVAPSLAEQMFKATERALDEAQVKAWQNALTGTEIAQPAICLCSLLWLGYLERLGLRPKVVAGHSLGELTAFYAAGAFDAQALMGLAALRGEAMSASEEVAGAMASLACSRQQAQELLGQVKGYIVIANINGPRQIVVSGEENAVAHALELAKERDIQVWKLPVSNAFHSQRVAGAAERLREDACIPPLFESTTARLLSSIDGHEVRPGCELKQHFARQILAPVDFVSLVEAMDQECELLVEVGPGRVLCGLVGSILDDEEKCFAVESKAESEIDLNLLLANYFARGGEVNWEVLYSGRLVRPFRPAWEMRFIENQCERPLRLSAGQQQAAASHRQGADSSRSLALAENALASLLAVPQDLLDRYLARRGPFLSAVVKADMDHLFDAEPSFQPMPTSCERVEFLPPEAEATSATMVASERFMQLVAARSGFPRSTLSPELRLLDDLNLDSIKAASLIAETATQLNLAGQLDPAEYANATLAEIGEVLDVLAGANTCDG
ncbi:MAG: type I polyketide synthase, partial [Candidatus Thiodiazotropha sp.]